MTDAIFRSLGNISGKQFFSPAYRLIKDRDALLLVPRLADDAAVSQKSGAEPGAGLAGRACVARPTILPAAATANPVACGHSPQCYLLDEKTESFSHPVQLSWEKIVLTDGEATSLQEKYPFRGRPDTACFDYDKLRFPLTLRRWQQGDWFIPFGMKGRKKVSDYFTDRKFSRPDKEKSWLLCSGNDILWIVGERTDNRFRITEETKIMLVVKISSQRDHHL